MSDIFGSVKICSCRLDHCTGHRMYELLTWKEIAEITVISICLSVAYLDSEIDHMQTRSFCHQLKDKTYAICWWYWNVATYMHGKLSMAKLKSSCLSYNIWVLVCHQYPFSIKYPSMKRKQGILRYNNEMSYGISLYICNLKEKGFRVRIGSQHNIVLLEWNRKNWSPCHRKCGTKITSLLVDPKCRA
jgi:hypothetical protein